MSPRLRRQILDRATAPYFATGRFNYHWSRGKLGGDPAFPALIERQLLPDGGRILDLGCGRGLLAAWLLAAEQIVAAGEWSAETPHPPHGIAYRGIELVGREVACGNQALRSFGARARLEQGDLRVAELGNPDAVVILDVLHYIDYAAQEAVLDAIRATLPHGGVFITRVGDAAGGLGFRISQVVDRCMTLAQGHRLPRMWCRPLGDWTATLKRRGFHVTTRSMSKGTPFANVMIVARLD